ncbi:sensor histidine kinase [Actinosynnema sp. CS-041913]|uniref:sensor histidine kinase n=1 Tax=Actinosynnema sp. CS-041913 TaxID=3239917 RepID=UPI003D90101F
MRFQPILVDVLLAVVITVLTMATAVAYGGTDPLLLVLVALTAAPLALRQHAPVITMCVILGAVAAYALIGDNVFVNTGVGLVVAMFTVATLRPRRVAALMFAATTLVLGAMYVKFAPAMAWSEALQATVIVLGTWGLGESTRRWGDRVERLAERAARAASDERIRIARELHDVVAHHMSVVSLQAGVAQYVLDTDLATARQAIATVGDTSREALTEMRRLLHVLRIDDHGELGPQPGLADLDTLTERMRRAGVPVDVVVRGDARPLPPGQDLCAYRIVQESLTNILKHAGPATARVTLDYTGHLLTLEIVNTGAQPPPPPPGHTPQGVRNMRERAELYGGTVAAGPVDGGFSVVLRLPTGRDR